MRDGDADQPVRDEDEYRPLRDKYADQSKSVHQLGSSGDVDQPTNDVEVAEGEDVISPRDGAILKDFDQPGGECGECTLDSRV